MVDSVLTNDGQRSAWKPVSEIAPGGNGENSVDPSRIVTEVETVDLAVNKQESDAVINSNVNYATADIYLWQRTA